MEEQDKTKEDINVPDEVLDTINSLKTTLELGSRLVNVHQEFFFAVVAMEFAFRSLCAGMDAVGVTTLSPPEAPPSESEPGEPVAA